MRFLFPVALLVASSASAWPSADRPSPIQKAKIVPGSECRDASKHFARKGGIWQEDPAKPKKLTELPPAEPYAAVYRLDERGCMVPVLYRDVRFLTPPKQR